MKRSRPTQRPDADRERAQAWFAEVVRGKGCALCGERWGVQGHHVIARQVIRREFPHGAVFDEGRWRAASRWGTEGLPFRSLADLSWDPRNGLVLCKRGHEQHEQAFKRVPMSTLPAAVFDFASELGLQHRLSSRFYQTTTG